MIEHETEYISLINTDDDNTIINSIHSFFQSSYLNNQPNLIYTSLFPSTDKLLNYLKTDKHKGISSHDIDQWRVHSFGSNVRSYTSHLFLTDYISDNLNDYILLLLILCALVDIIIGEIQRGNLLSWYEGLVLFNIVFIVVVLNSILDYNKDLHYEAMQHKFKQTHVNVIRNGMKTQIDINNVLGGDIVLIKQGDVIPCMDCIVVEGSFIVREHKMKHTITKREGDLMFSGSSIVEGYGKVVVCVIGSDCYIERQREYATAYEEYIENKKKFHIDNKLQKKITKLAIVLGNSGFVCSLVIFVMLTVKEIVVRVYNGVGIIDVAFLDVMNDNMIIALCVLLITLPQNLPKILSITLAYSFCEMEKKNALLLNPSKIDILGEVNEVVVDFDNVVIDCSMLIAKGVYMDEKECSFEEGIKNNRSIVDVMEATLVNVNDVSYAKYVYYENDNIAHCIRNTLMHNDISFTYCSPLYLYMSPDYTLIIAIYKNNNNYFAYTRGLFEQCVNFIGNSTQCGLLNQQYQRYNELGYECVLFLKKEISSMEMNDILSQYANNGNLNEYPKEMYEHIIRESTLCFLVTFSFKINENVATYINKCNKMGINVRLVTEKSLHKAISVMKECSIITSEVKEQIVKENEHIVQIASLASNSNENVSNNYLKFSPLCLAGKDFFMFTGGINYEDSNSVHDNESNNKKRKPQLKHQDKFIYVTKNLQMLYDIRYQDKLLLTHGLKQNDKVVAFIGSHNLDDKIFPNAHIGISLHKSSNQNNKEESDIVLLDNSLYSFVQSCKFGRNIYENVQKYITFALSANIVIITIIIIGILFARESPLNGPQIIWLNIIIDSLTAFVLVTEYPEINHGDIKINIVSPIKPKDKIISFTMKVNIIIQSIYQITLSCFILFHARINNDEYGNEMNFTVFYNVLVYFQICNAINCRKVCSRCMNPLCGIGNNYKVLLYYCGIVICNIMIVSIGSGVLRLRKLTLMQHCHCLLIGISLILVGMLVKIVLPRYEEKQHGIVDTQANISEQIQQEGIMVFEQHSLHEDANANDETEKIRRQPKKRYSIGKLLKHTKDV